MQKPKAIFCWSGGKDSSLALYKIVQEEKFEVVSLLTTLNRHHHRISMHGIREQLLDEQAIAMELPLSKVWVSDGSNEEYEREMERQLLFFKEKGVTHVIFGDIFLGDLRAYRESKLSVIGMQAVFPLWQKDTKNLINEFLLAGFETITCCISNKYLDKSFVGRKVDAEFINELPLNVDPCGENGEFHSFCYKGPIFKKEILFAKGDTVFKPVTAFGAEGKDGFWFIDLVPINN